MTEAVTGAVLTIMKSRDEIDLHMASAVPTETTNISRACDAMRRDTAQRNATPLRSVIYVCRKIRDRLVLCVRYKSECL